MGDSTVPRYVSIPHRYGKNPNGRSINIAVSTFPFLIGTVRTPQHKNYQDTDDYVSIPHRYGKNSETLKLLEYLSSVSIPHRYGKNSLPSARYVSSCVFPFLIGTVRTVSNLADESVVW